MGNPARIAAAAAVARASVVATDSAMQRYAMRAVDPDTSDEEVDVFQTCRGCSGTGTMKLRRRAGGINTIQCPGCNGKGKLDFEDPAPHLCSACGGAGIISTLAIPTDPNQGLAQIPCGTCQGCGLVPAGW